MNIFEQAYLNLLNEDNETPQTEREELTYLRKVLKRYWNVDQDTILQIDKIINAKDKPRFKQNRVQEENELRKYFYGSKDAVDGLADNNEDLVAVKEYVSREGGDVSTRVQIPKNEYISSEYIMSALRDKGINIDQETLNSICKIQPSIKGKGTGAGEVLCKTLLNVSNSDVGDGLLNGTEKVQIKGFEGRIKGPQNYGRWNDVIKYYNDQINNKINALQNPSKDATPTEEERKLKNNVIKDWKSLIVADNKPASYLFPLIKGQVKNLNEEVINGLNIILLEAMKKLFTDASNDLIQPFVNTLLFDNEYQKAFLDLCLKYYRINDHWKYMIVIDNVGDVFHGLWMSGDLDEEGNWNQLLDHVYIRRMPSCDNGGDNRPAAIQIEYKGDTLKRKRRAFVKDGTQKPKKKAKRKVKRKI